MTRRLDRSHLLRQQQMYRVLEPLRSFIAPTRMSPLYRIRTATRLGKFVIAYAYAVYCWIVFAVVLLTFGSLIVVWPGGKAQRRWIARCGARLLFSLARISLTVSGLERLPRGPHILLVNHSSFLDALILTAALPSAPGYAFVARQQYRRQAVLWPLLRAVGTIVLHPTRSHSSPSNVALLLRALACRERLILFPEGGIKRYAGIQPFHSGAFIAAAQAGAPLVVAGIAGARRALPLGRWRPTRSPLSVKIGAVLINKGAGLPEVASHVTKARSMMAELAAENMIMPAGPVD